MLRDRVLKEDGLSSFLIACSTLGFISLFWTKRGAGRMRVSVCKGTSKSLLMIVGSNVLFLVEIDVLLKLIVPKDGLIDNLLAPPFLSLLLDLDLDFLPPDLDRDLDFDRLLRLRFLVDFANLTFFCGVYLKVKPCSTSSSTCLLSLSNF